MHLWNLFANTNSNSFLFFDVVLLLVFFTVVDMFTKIYILFSNTAIIFACVEINLSVLRIFFYANRKLRKCNKYKFVLRALNFFFCFENQNKLIEYIHWTTSCYGKKREFFFSIKLVCNSINTACHFTGKWPGFPNSFIEKN